MKKLIWMTFDLGVRGDYEGIYEFLDARAAKECGDNTAVLQYEFKDDAFSELKKDLARSVKLDRRSRIYVVAPDEKGNYKGTFIAGGRKSPPWTGFKTLERQEEDIGE